ncbi:unnamed protein product [Cyprideis torosa]|uniref:Protein kinase domain-containing protein n=1 Tax=Cyprideis torosa TaxID=163714 RepID=A0A7R8X250_9CRUS|nr:unnamed protein product [Cyprideis torosa]CAG0911642.1 unnamed protein product [Cyprideis torosa]
MCLFQVDIQEVSIDDPELRTSYANLAAPHKIERRYIMDPDPIWEIDRESLQLGCILDEGAFGKVRSQESQYLGIKVVCKTLKDTHCDSDVLDLVRELEVMKAVGKHQNIINLLGACTQGVGPLFVVGGDQP